MLLLLRLERFHRCEKVFSFRLKSRSEALRDLLDNHSVAEAFPQLLLFDHALPEPPARYRIAARSRDASRSVQVRYRRRRSCSRQAEPTAGAIVRFNDASKRCRLARAWWTPEERCVAPKRTPYRGDLLPIEIISAREHWGIRIGVSDSRLSQTECSLRCIVVEVGSAVSNLFEPFLEPLDEEGRVRDQSGPGDGWAQVLLQGNDQHPIAEGDDASLHLLTIDLDADRCVVTQVPGVRDDEPIEPHPAVLTDSLTIANIKASAALLPDRAGL